MLLRQIEYLQAVIECDSFHLAAQQCHVSQSAISQKIKKLEVELGYYKGYHGNEFSEAVALFSEKYPTVEIQIRAGRGTTLL